MTILETERLALRPYTQDDFDALYEILSDPETMKHYPKPYDAKGTQRWLDWNFANYRDCGFGLWAVVLKETGEFIGDCGITMQSINGQTLPEIGYHIHKAHWRKGYASEAARCCMAYAFDTLGFPAVYSYMTDSNAASYGVALKNGMKLVETYEDAAHVKHRVYAITLQEWNDKYE